MKMMMISQTNALTPAQAQPSPSSSPNRARRRGTAVPGPSACWAIVLHPSTIAPTGRWRTSLNGQRPCHRRMHGAQERVAPGRECGHLIVLGRDAWEGRALEFDRPTGVLDLDVVRSPGVLVVELDDERLLGRGGQRRRVEGDVHGLDLDGCRVRVAGGG